jgi:hypothetical protein
MMQARYRVTLWESESGWGRKPFLDRDFDTLEAAQSYYRAENAKNNLPSAPSYYIYAEAPVLVDAERNPPRDY